MESSSAAGGGAPPPLLLAPLLQDLHAWLSSPTLGSSSPLPSPSPTPAGTASAAMRASSALFNLLPAGSRGATPPPAAEEGDGGRPSIAAGEAEQAAKKKKVKCRCVEAFGNNLYIGTSDGQVLWYTYDPTGSVRTACPPVMRDRLRGAQTTSSGRLLRRSLIHCDIDTTSFLDEQSRRYISCHRLPRR